MRHIRALAAVGCAALALLLGYTLIPGSGAKLQDTQTGTFTVKVTIPETPPAAKATSEKKVGTPKQTSSPATPTEIPSEKAPSPSSAPSITSKSPETEEKDNESTPQGESAES